MTGLAGKSALVTGAARGLGRAIAERLAADGAAVLVTDKDGDVASEVVEAIRRTGGRAAAMTLDVTETEQAAAAVEKAVAEHGRLDIHVSNAGVTWKTPFLEASRELFDQIVSINLTGCFLCGQAAARQMVAQGDGGAIVNIASISGQRGGTGRAAYGASKAGIINLTQVMAIELAPYGIRVNAVAPGPTDVGRPADGPKQQAAFMSRLMIKRRGRPEETAAAVSFLVSEDAGWVTGHVLNVDGGFNAGGVMFDPEGEV